LGVKAKGTNHELREALLRTIKQHEQKLYIETTIKLKNAKSISIVSTPTKSSQRTSKGRVTFAEDLKKILSPRRLKCAKENISYSKPDKSKKLMEST
jgi:hypothetical protein